MAQCFQDVEVKKKPNRSLFYFQIKLKTQNKTYCTYVKKKKSVLLSQWGREHHRFADYLIIHHRSPDVAFFLTHL